MRTGFVPGFLPSTCGFRFANRFPPQPLWRLPVPGLRRLRLGNAANGLCGGMVFAACDLFAAGLPPPDVSAPPGYGDPLYHFLVRRLIDSFRLPGGPVKYYRWMAAADRPGPRCPAWRTAYREWPLVRREIDAGRPAPLGLVRVRSRNPLRLGLNHQVLAYAYRLKGAELTVWVYDPNHPGRDDVTLTVGLDRLDAGRPIEASTGEPVRGFFWTPYRPPRRGRGEKAVAFPSPRFYY